MTIDPKAALVETLQRFLQQAKEAVDEDLNRNGPLPLTPRLLAERLTELPACCEADAAAHRAATDNEYSVTSLPRRRRSAETTATTEVTTDVGATDSQPEDDAAEPYGRPLDADVLLSTGVLSLLKSRLPQPPGVGVGG